VYCCARFGRICQKWLDAGLARAGAEIQFIPACGVDLLLSALLMLIFTV